MKLYCLPPEIHLSTHPPQFFENLGTCWWLLKLKGDLWSLVILFLEAQRKLQGSIGLVLHFKRAMCRFTALDKGKIFSCSEENRRMVEHLKFELAK